MRVTYALLLALLVAACASRPFESADLRDDLPAGAVALFNEAQKPISVDPGVQPRPHLHILALSGGGAAGAFGAGVLAGWSQTGKRPKFDIVTGVSTGALIAVLSFLGPKYDGLLQDVYTNTSDEDIYRRKGPFSLFSDSLLDNAPFKRRLNEVVTQPLLEEIAVEYRLGRRLYVATTNLDAGKLVVWDVGKIAASGHPQALKAVRRILKASAAVPGFFKPVYIRASLSSKSRQMHVDGGVKAPVLIRSFMFNAPARRRTLYVVINGKLQLHNAASAVKPKVLDISRRSIDELMRGLTYKTLYQGYVAARNAGSAFRLIKIPDNAQVSDNALKFDPAEMRKLYQLGYNMAASPGSWSNEPPRLETNERVTGARTNRRRRARR